MKKNYIFIYIAAFLSILIPIPGRFVFGFTILMELTLISLFGTLISFLVTKLKIENLRTVTVLFTLITITVIFRQVLVLICSEVALILGFVIYLPTISLFLIGTIFKNDSMPLKLQLKSNMLDVLYISIAGLLFSLFRDIAGYGTFSFFGANHQIYEKVIINPEKVGVFAFFSTIPGALFLAGIIFGLFILFNQKRKILENSYLQDSNNIRKSEDK